MKTTTALGTLPTISAVEYARKALALDAQATALREAGDASWIMVAADAQAAVRGWKNAQKREAREARAAARKAT